MNRPPRNGQQHGVHIVGQQKRPSIMVGVPMYRHPNPTFVGKLIGAMMAFKEMFGWDVIYFAPTASVASWARREIMRRFLETDSSCEGIWWADDDMDWGEGNEGFNAIANLMQHKLDFVSGLYFKRQMPTVAMCGMQAPDGLSLPVSDLALIDGNDLFKVDYVGFGMCYTSRRLLEKVYEDCGRNIDAPFAHELNWKEKLKEMDPYHTDTSNVSLDVVEMAIGRATMFYEDFSFCRKARRAGFEIWVDPSFELTHAGDYWYGVRDFIWQEKKRLNAVADLQAKAAQGPVLVQ